MKNLITLETAKLFMEKELNNPIKSIDDLENSSKLEYEHFYCPDGYGDTLLELDYAVNTCVERNGWEIYPVFPQEDVKTYLRETYNIIVESTLHSGISEHKFGFRVHIITDDRREMIDQMPEHLDDNTQSYEEALELGLKVGIERIK